MSIGLSEKIRSMAKAAYVKPAMIAGKSRFSIRVRDMITALQAEGYPPSYTPQICSALQTRRFLIENNLEIEEVEGPPKKVSPTVVIRYRLAKQEERTGSVSARAEESTSPRVEEDSDAWAERVTKKIRGLLKDEIAEMGGAEAFIHWVRGYDEEDVA